MKFNRTFIGLSSAAVVLTAAIATVHFVAHAKDAAPAVRVDSTPVNRAAGSGNSYAPVIKKVSPSVVNIYSSRLVKQRLYRKPMLDDPFLQQFFGNQVQGDGRERTRRENWLGSGIIVTADGYVLTASHVVEGADEIKVSISSNKTEYAAVVVGTDPATDIAILKISAHDLPALTLGDSSQAEVGDVVLAIGNPFGLGQTVTRGIISALGRSLPMPDEANGQRRAHVQDFIQTDAAINQGNSGGALVDAEGRLIGINDALVSPSGTSAGIGFAVPVNLARNVMDGIINGGRVTRGYLGIDPQDVDANLAKSFGAPNASGALIADVGPDSPATKAGLMAGDIIIALNDKEISGADNLRATVSQLHPGEPTNVKIIRNGAQKIIAVTLGERPDAAPVAVRPKHPVAENLRADALDGVQVQDLDAEFRRQLQAPLNVVGAVVTDVAGGSNSADAGLRLGDVIVEINHQPVADDNEAVNLGMAARSEQILLKIWRRTGDLAGTRFISVDNTKRAK